MIKAMILLSTMIVTTTVMAEGLDIKSILDGTNPWIVLAVMIVEFVLGRTKWVEANSTIELILNLFLGLFKKGK